MSETVHVWRMTNDATPNFAAGDILIRCESPDEDEARLRAGFRLLGSTGETRAEYLGEMSVDEYYTRLAAHQRTTHPGGDLPH